jgi:serine protease
MKNRVLLLASILSLSACAEVEVPEAADDADSTTLSARATEPEGPQVIIAFHPGRGGEGKAAIRGQGGRVVTELHGLEAVAARLPAPALEALRRNPNVEYVEEDALRYPSSTGGTAESVPYGITMVQADQVVPGGYRRKVCIIDSGYSMQHEDLQDTNVTASPDTGTGDPFYDDNGHGTHVAGTIGALGNNGVGVRGVNQNGSVDFHIVKVFTKDGWAYSSSLANAAQKCADAGAQVINMSLGGASKSKTEQRKFDQLSAQGILSIAAAGNDGNSAHSYPASYASVLSVAAVDSNRQVADFSQFNSGVDIAAPGVAVLSTTPWITDASITVAGAAPVPGNPVENSAEGSASGALVNGGLCDTVGGWSGKVVLCQRGTVTFWDKVRNGQDGGAVAVIIYNNEVGDLHATLGDGNSSTIPALGVSDTQGAALVAQVGSTATVVSDTEFPASGYEAWDGTSMATPHVAGVAALVWSHNNLWTAAQVRDALIATAVDLGTAGRDNYYGSGLVQAKAALDHLIALGGGGPAPSNQAPVAAFSFTCTGLTCAFDGSASSDPDGSIASHSWSFGATGATASHTFASGTHQVTLTVTDNAGATSSTTKTVSVSDGSPTALVISNVRSDLGTGRSFTISWTTNLPSNSVVTFTGYGSFTNATLVTSHSMGFNGTRGATYEYTVSSTDANGNTVTAGPFVHQN